MILAMLPEKRLGAISLSAVWQNERHENIFWAASPLLINTES